MRQTGILYLLTLCFFTVAANNAAYTQSFSKADSAHVFQLLEKAESLLTTSNYDSALVYCDKAEQYSRQKGFKKGMAYSLIKKTNIYIDKEELATADLYPAKANTLGQQINDSLVMAIAVMQMAQVKMYDGKLDEAILLFNKCITTYFSRHPSEHAALAYNDLGFTYKDNGELLKSSENLLKAIQIHEQVNPDDYGELAVALNNLSTVYYELGNKEKAIEYAKRSITFREKDGDILKLSLGCCNLSQIYLGVDDAEAVRYQNLCVKYAEQSGNEARIIHAYITSSLIASNQKDIQKSLDYELKVISLLEKSKSNLSTLARRYISAGMSSNTLHKDSVVIVGYFNNAVEKARQLNDKFNLRDVYYQLAVFYKEHKDYTRAYEYYTKHILYKDSVINGNTATNIAELEKKYQTEKKDNEILRLNTTQRIKQLQIEKQNALLAGNLLEAKKKESEIELLSKAAELQELRISQQDEQLEKQQLLAKNNEQQLQLAEKEKQLQQRKLKNAETIRNFILAGIALLSVLAYFLFNRYQLKRKIREQEALLAVRNNIAKDLHDEIGSTLTSIKILSEVSEKSLHKDQVKASSFLQKITEQSSAVQQGISDIVWAVKPENDRMENMLIRMREYIAQTLEAKNIQTSINIDEQILHNTLDMNQRRDFFLIFREAINNIAKYAGATTVAISLGKKNQELQMQITDNGKGFDVSKVTSSNGLKNMQSRATALNGKLLIESKTGIGTTLLLQLPTTS
jgi:two-component system, NarL family, sensor histidine kinase UhpB